MDLVFGSDGAINSPIWGATVAVLLCVDIGHVRTGKAREKRAIMRNVETLELRKGIRDEK